MEANSSYKQIVRTTGIYGISQLVNILLGILRSKITAVLLGTVGIGVIGLLQSVIDITRATTGLGLDTGAVKKIAVTNSANNSELSKALFSVNIWYLLTAILGGIVCILFAKPISIQAFGDSVYTLHIAALSIVVLFVTLSAGLVASLQGMRKIYFMALISSLGSLLSLLVMIPIYYYWGIDGIIPTYIASNVILFSVSLFFYKKVEVRLVQIPFKEVLSGGKEMVKLGLYIVAAGILSAGSLFVVRAYLSREEGLEFVGLFQAAWLTVTLVSGIILRSANSDFFPKLCSLVDSRSSIRNFVNQQTHIILLIISPLIIGLVTFSGYVIYILYSSAFMGAVGVLRWHLIAAFLKMAVTPSATVMLAKNRGDLHLLCETIFWGTYLLACYLLYPRMGLVGLGCAYFVAYLVYMPSVLFVSRRISDSMWSLSVFVLFVANILLIGICCAVNHFFPQYSLITGSIILLLASSYSFFQLRSFLNIQAIIKWMKKKREK